MSKVIQPDVHYTVKKRHTHACSLNQYGYVCASQKPYCVCVCVSGGTAISAAARWAESSPAPATEAAGGRQPAATHTHTTTAAGAWPHYGRTEQVHTEKINSDFMLHFCVIHACKWISERHWQSWQLCIYRCVWQREGDGVLPASAGRGTAEEGGRAEERTSQTEKGERRTGREKQTAADRTAQTVLSIGHHCTALCFTGSSAMHWFCFRVETEVLENVQLTKRETLTQAEMYSLKVNRLSHSSSFYTWTETEQWCDILCGDQISVNENHNKLLRHHSERTLAQQTWNKSARTKTIQHRMIDLPVWPHSVTDWWLAVWKRW